MTCHLPESAYWRSLPLEKLESLERAERQRGLGGHWSYDLPRHRAMIEVLRERKAAEGRATAKNLEAAE